MTLAIKGHATRGKEVIEILEMLGASGSILEGTASACAYFINDSGRINYTPFNRLQENYTTFTLEGFLEKFPYKVGDKVIVSETQKIVTIEGMSWRNGCEVIYDTCYNNDCVSFYSAEELQPYKEQETMEEPTIHLAPEQLGGEQIIIPIPKGYEFAGVDDDNQQVVFEKIKPKYPKTHEECCDILSIEYPYFKTEDDGISASTYKNKLFGDLKRLLICRDAYWKLAGDWKPDWTSVSDVKYCIGTAENEIISRATSGISNYILAFGTAEIRDAFYENFKSLIEECKELL